MLFYLRKKNNEVNRGHYVLPAMAKGIARTSLSPIMKQHVILGGFQPQLDIVKQDQTFDWQSLQKASLSLVEKLIVAKIFENHCFEFGQTINWF